MFPAARTTYYDDGCDDNDYHDDGDHNFDDNDNDSDDGDSLSRMIGASLHMV